MKKIAKSFVKLVSPFTTRETRASSSSNQRGGVAYEENHDEFTFHLSQCAEVKQAMWPCDEFRSAAGISTCQLCRRICQDSLRSPLFIILILMNHMLHLNCMNVSVASLSRSFVKLFISHMRGWNGNQTSIL